MILLIAMDINLEKGTITIFGKNEKLNSLALKLSAISGEQVYSFFTNKNCFIPRMLNIYAMAEMEFEGM